MPDDIFKFHLVALINKQKPSALQQVLSSLSIYTGHKMQCPTPLESANYLE